MGIFNFERRIQAYANPFRWKAKPTLHEMVCILPIGRGVWWPVKNLTERLDEIRTKTEIADRNLKDLKAMYKNEHDHVRNYIKERGNFYAGTAIVIDDKGTARMQTVEDFFNFELDMKLGLVAEKKDDTKKKSEPIRPDIQLIRPGRQNNNQKQKQNNQQQHG